MKDLNCKIWLLTLCFTCILASCESFVEIETPNHKIDTHTVFSNDDTAISAINGIYNELVNSHYSGGWNNSVTVLAGMSADILQPIRTTHNIFGPFNENEISISDTPDANANLNLWSSTYNIIYIANSILEGLQNSKNITHEIRRSVEGQALFIRAFSYFHLTNLYGDIPLILTTDYRKNAIAPRIRKDLILEQVSNDLDRAMDLLKEVENYKNFERTNVNRYVVIAFYARVNLYLKKWSKAEMLSTEVINQTNLFKILDDLSTVFLANSNEAIWQISPIGSNGGGSQTMEGSIFIIHPTLPFISSIKLKDDFVSSMHSDDKRLTSWIGYHEGVKSYYPYKYKDRNSINNNTEYSMVLRLAEQYLIRAEARTMQDNVPGALEDINVIRKRAGLTLLTNMNQNIGTNDLMDLIMDERKLELFSEWGHRWLDLKRTKRASQVLKSIKPFWQDTDINFPIPGEERIKNPNLTQNEGY